MKKPYSFSSLPSYSEAWSACRKPIIVCVVLSLLVALAAAIMVINRRPLDGDEPGYVILAKNIASGKGYYYPNYWLAEKAPGYSTFVAGTLKIFGGSLIPARIIQTFLHVLMVVLTILMAYRMTRSLSIVWITGLVAASDAYVAVFRMHMLSESLFDPAAFGMVLAFDDALRRGKLKSWMLTGLLFALSIYLRPTLIMLPVFLIVMLIAIRMPLKKLIIGFGAASLVAFVVLLPWSIRNYNVFGVFTPVPAYGGTCLNAQVKNDIARSKGEPTKEWTFSKAGINVYKESELQKKEAIQLIKDNPKVFLLSVPTKSFQLWTSSEWRSAGKMKSKALGALRLLALVMALMAFFSKRLDGLFKISAFVMLGYITLLTAISANPEYRYAFWTYPLYYLLVGVILSKIGMRLKLIRSEPVK